MADKKISALPAATTPLAGSEVLPIVQGGTTDQVSVANLTSGRTVDMLVANVVLNDAGTNSVSYPVVATHTSSGSTAPGFGVGVNFLQENTTYSSNIQVATIESISTSEADIHNDMVFRTKYNNLLAERARIRNGSDFVLANGNFVVGTAGKGVTTSVTNGDVTITPLGTGKTILANNGLRIPNNAAVTVGTSATQISVNAISWSSLAFVFGVDGGGAAFSDLVFYADGNTVALASRTVSGVPAARTYTAPSGQLNLAMGSGSYSVFFQHIWTA